MRTETPGVESLADFQGVETVIRDPIRFKLRLGIGDNAYASIRYGRTVKDLLNAGTAGAAGAGIAASSTVATTFFGGGWLAALGFGVAATPIGWVVAAGVASAGAYYGVMRLIETTSDGRVQKIPEFINTPIDLLGASLLDLMATLGLKMAQSDDHLHPGELECIETYFVEEWGYDREYVRRTLDLIEHCASEQSLSDAATVLANFKRSNADCDFAAMRKEIMAFMHEIAEADGIVDGREQAALEVITDAFAAADKGLFSRTVDNVSNVPLVATEWAGSLKRNLPRIPSWRVRQEGEAEVFENLDAVPDKAAKQAATLQLETIPILWLLGKTAAGKSSLIRLLTGLTDAEVGNGFAPCTRTSQQFDFPRDRPLVRFLDTRGLGEAGYDPAADIEQCEGHSHAILVVARLDDPVQGEVAEALRQVLKRRPEMQVLLVHTGPDLIDDPASLERARAANAAVFEKAAGRTITQIMLSLKPGAGPDQTHLDDLIEHLGAFLPAAALVLARQQSSDAEGEVFLKVRSRVLFYSGVAASSDIAPVIGAVSVPLTQLAMLRELGGHYGVVWSKSLLAGFFGALGVSFAARYGASLGMRQLAKLIPVVGQTAGAAASGSVSFCTTYALGRAAGKYLHSHVSGAQLSSEELKSAYRDALRNAVNA